MSRILKESGVEWIGKIPDGWKVTPFYVLADVFGRIGFRGYTSEDLVDYGQGPITLSPTNIIDNKLNLDNCSYISREKYEESPEIKVFKNDIILVKTASIGKCAIYNSEEKATLNPQLIVLKNLRCNYKFLYYVLISDIIQTPIKLDNFGSVIPTITQRNINHYKIPLPSSERQQKIADYLDKKCSKIDEQKANYEKSIQLLKEYKQSLITKAIIGHPKVKLKYIIDGKLQYGANSSGIEYNKDLPRYVRITDIDGDNLKDDDKLSLTEEEAKDFILQDGDILFARSGGTVGKTFRYKSDFGLCGFAGYLIRAKFENPELSQYVYNFTKSSLYENWKNGIFIQSTIQNIGADKYSLLQIPIPTNHDDIVKINKIIKTKCSKIDKVISYREQMIEKLEEYKKSLIYESVTGKKEIK